MQTKAPFSGFAARAKLEKDTFCQGANWKKGAQREAVENKTNLTAKGWLSMRQSSSRSRAKMVKIKKDYALGFMRRA
jgi:hypothetical protein